MAPKEDGMSPTKMEAIRSTESFIFWLERVAILIQLRIYPSPPYLMSFTALLLVITNTLYLYLFVERQFIRPFSFEPEVIFYIERLAILLVILHYLVPGGCVFCAVEGVIVLILTNYVMIYLYYHKELQEQLATRTNIILYARKETRKGDHENYDDDKEEKKGKDDQSRKSKVKVNCEEWLFDYLSPWGCSSSNGEKGGVLGSYGSANIVMEPSKDGKLKKQEPGIEEETREKSEIDGAEAASDLEGDNNGWEKVPNDLSESSSCQEKVSGVEVANIVQETTDNYKSDYDNSWEEVRNIDGGIKAATPSSQQKEFNELDEAELKEEDEATNNPDSDNTDGKPSSSISACEFWHDVLHEYEESSLKWKQEKKDLTEKLEVATEFWKQYEENYYKLQEEVEDLKTIKLQQTKTLGEYQMLKKESEEERLNWNEEKEYLQSKLEQERLNWNEEKEYLQSKLDVMTESLEHERHNWNEENRFLQLKLNDARESLEQHHLKSKEEKKQLSDELDVARKSLENYMAIEKGFAEDRQRWEEQKNDFMAIISQNEKSVNYYEKLIENHDERCWLMEFQLNERQQSLNKLTAANDDLSAKLASEINTVESYRSLCLQSCKDIQLYKTCFEESEEKYRRLLSNPLNFPSKLDSSSFWDRYHRVIEDLQGVGWKEEEKTHFIGLYCAAYGSSLYDFVKWV